MSIDEAVELVCAERPALHGPADRPPISLGLRKEVLAALAEQLGPDKTTLETGCGHSTVVFAASGARHTVISPMASEHERIRAFCAEHGIATDRVRFLEGDSRLLLPTLETPPLDFVLIDGCHAFPSPSIDWFYTARKLKGGGRMMVDDTHIVTGKTLRDFLSNEGGRWRVVKELRRTSLFEKTTDRSLESVRWSQQPYCEQVFRFRKISNLLKPIHDAVFRRPSRAGIRDAELD